jgi:hypothetical protein
LATDFFGGIRVLLGAGRCALRNLFHLLERAGDLPDTQSLFVTARTPFVDQPLHIRGTFRDAGHGGGDFFEIRAPLARFGNRLLDQLASILGRLRASLGKVANLVRHDGKTHARLTGASRFHSSVQGQDIGLKCDLVDNFDDFGYLVAGGCDLVH